MNFKEKIEIVIENNVCVYDEDSKGGYLSNRLLLLVSNAFGYFPHKLYVPMETKFEENFVHFNNVIFTRDFYNDDVKKLLDECFRLKDKPLFGVYEANLQCNVFNNYKQELGLFMF